MKKRKQLANPKPIQTLLSDHMSVEQTSSRHASGEQSVLIT